MLVSGIAESDLTKELIQKMLFDGIVDTGESGECIFVFGSISTLEIRIPKAVEMYKAGRAKKILLSGGNRFGQREVPEAIVMKERAMQLGVSECNILIETISNHTKENVLASTLVLDRELGLNKIKRILVVTSLHHMKRSLAFLKTYMPAWIEYTLCPAQDPNALPESWWTNEIGVRRVMHEARGIIRSVKEGHIEDFQI